MEGNDEEATTVSHKKQKHKKGKKHSKKHVQNEESGEEPEVVDIPLDDVPPVAATVDEGLDDVGQAVSTETEEAAAPKKSKHKRQDRHQDIDEAEEKESTRAAEEPEVEQEQKQEIDDLKEKKRSKEELHQESTELKEVAQVLSNATIQADAAATEELKNELLDAVLHPNDSHFDLQHFLHQ